MRDNTERYDELFAIGYHTAAKQLTKLAWYHRSNILLYLWRIVRDLAPFKVPEAIKRRLK
jgi:hypothetical protein